MKILLANYCALDAQKRIMELKRGELERRFPSFFMRSAREAVAGRSIPLPEGALYCRPAGEGGIFSALWRMAETLDTGLLVDIKKIPLRQETIEILELYDINPYYALSDSCLMAVLEDPEPYLAELLKMKIPAAVIGELKAGAARILTNGERIRYLDRAQDEELLKIPGAYPVRRDPV